MAIKSETRPVSGFDRISVRYHGDVVLEQGDTEGLVIEADEELLPRIKSEVQDGKLTIGIDVQWWEWLTEWMKFSNLDDKKIRYKINMRQISGISLSGSVNLQAAQIKSDDCCDLDLRFCQSADRPV